MKKYTYNNVTTDYLPDPLKTDAGEVSPVSEGTFVALGGTITDDGEMSPKEKFEASLTALLTSLKAQADALALDITIDEFKAAAGSMMSSELIAWAKDKGVPDEMIEAVRPQILTMIADASRLGMTWSDIFPKVEVGE